MGNPSYQEVLALPLVVTPPPGWPGDGPRRTQDLHARILALAGAEASTPLQLGESEHFVGEMHYLTYRDGRFKSTLHRRNGALQLFDLVRDPGEQTDVAAQHPEIAQRHEARSRELAALHASEVRPEGELGDDERERLRILGYLEE